MTIVDRFEEWPAFLALFTGACWLCFLLHAGRALSGGVSWKLCIAALLLGAASIPITHFFIYVQEVGWGLKESDDLAAGVKYFVLGVGLREEFAKLLMVLPLLPWLVRGRSELQALFVCACVGLGFAVIENMSYFGGTIDVPAIGRLLSANFMHAALTGLVGLSACRACWHPKSLGPEMVAVFSVAVLVHGAYDAFIAVPALAADYGIFSSILYVLAVYQFFREFNAANPKGSYRLNLALTLTLGVSLVVASTLVYVSAMVGVKHAAELLAQQALGSAVLVYLFLRESPDSLIDR